MLFLLFTKKSEGFNALKDASSRSEIVESAFAGAAMVLVGTIFVRRRSFLVITFLVKSGG